jgi:uncharacterized membrane protein YhhN
VKLTKFEKSFTALFFVIIVIELFSSTISSLSSFHIVAKPLIVLSLIFFFYLKGTHLELKTRKIMLLALVFSLIGDISIMFDHVSTNYFLIGLISFLIAHIMYVLVFLENRKKSQKSISFIVILIVYTSTLFYILKDGLNEMLIPVIIYILVILAMAITASYRKGNVTTLSYNLVLVGALFFVVSDSILAINKFHTAITSKHLLIMITYALAQYCIVMGVLKQKD